MQVPFCIIRAYQLPDQGNYMHSLKTLDGLATAILVALTFLLPLFFLPVSGMTLGLAKATLLQVGVSITLLLWLIARLKEGSITLPKTYVLLSVAFIPIIALVSAMFSPSVSVSLFGAGGEITTVIALTFFVLFFFLGSQLIQTTKRIFAVIAALTFSALLLGIVELVRLFAGPDVLSFGIFNSIVSNPVGKWNDLSLFFGLATVLSLFSINRNMVAGVVRIAVYALLVISLFILIVTGFTLTWILVGIFALMFFVRGLLASRASGGKMPVMPLIISVFAILFLLPGNALPQFLSDSFDISQVEVRPSWSSTVEITKATVSENPVLGVGPNRFTGQWLLHKPNGVNETFFWNTEFNFGIGVIPSLVVTVGLLGLLSWLVFFGMFLYIGSRALVVPENKERMLSHFAFVSFLAALFLWPTLIFYVPSFTLVALAFLFSGITIGALTQTKAVDARHISFTENPRAGFVSVLMLVILIIISVVAGYFFVQRALAAWSFGNGLESFNQGNIGKAEQHISQSIALYPHDSYHRALAEVRVARLGEVLSQQGNEEAVRSQFQTLLGNAITSARNATDYDSTRYQNWLMLGRVYQSVVPLEIEGAYERANEAYTQAKERNPRGPSMGVALARLDIARGNLESARGHLQEALALKTNYTEALFLLSQIEAQQGNLQAAITQTERASLTSPNDFGIFFQLGFLRYQNENYSQAISALERAVQLNSVYANAKYFLGLAYHKVGRVDDAVAQFEDVQTLNPDNTEVQKILSNLRSGQDPFASIVPPEAPPEERDGLPVEEEQTQEEVQ